MSKKKLNRYVMCYSQADCAWCVVYAKCLWDAEEMWENGEYVLEEDDGECEDIEDEECDV